MTTRRLIDAAEADNEKEVKKLLQRSAVDINSSVPGGCEWERKGMRGEGERSDFGIGPGVIMRQHVCDDAFPKLDRKLEKLWRWKKRNLSLTSNILVFI